MKNGSVKSDEIFINQAISGFQVLIGVEAKLRTNGITAIKGETVTIRGHNQKQIQQQLVLTQCG